MTTSTPPLLVAPEPNCQAASSRPRCGPRTRRPSSPRRGPPCIAVVIAVAWTIPTVGLLVNSTRDAARPEHHRLVELLERRRTRSPSRTTPNAWTGKRDRRPLSAVPPELVRHHPAGRVHPDHAWPCWRPMRSPGSTSRARTSCSSRSSPCRSCPIQVALIPLNTLYVKFGLNTSFWSIWLSHTIFGLPLAIFLLHNFMKEIPASLIEAARVDGAGHVKIFFQVLLPLLVPAIASFAIFQFLWVWNDLLVGADVLRPEHQADHRGHPGSDHAVLRLGRHPAGGGGHRHVGAAGGVPLAAAVLRPRPAGRRVKG